MDQAYKNARTSVQGFLDATVEDCALNLAAQDWSSRPTSRTKKTKPPGQETRPGKREKAARDYEEVHTEAWEAMINGK